MERKEKTWKIVATVLAIVGAALLIVTLVLRLTGKDVTVLTYPIIGVVILFLIADEMARMTRRRIEKEEAEREKAEHPEANTPEPTLPPEAFDFETTSADEKEP